MKKTEILHIRLSSNDYEMIKEAAAEKGISVSDYCRNWVNMGIAVDNPLRAMRSEDHIKKIAGSFDQYLGHLREHSEALGRNKYILQEHICEIQNLCDDFVKQEKERFPGNTSKSREERNEIDRIKSELTQSEEEGTKKGLFN